MPCFSCSCFKDGKDRNGKYLSGGRGYCSLWDQEYWRGHECGDYAPTWSTPSSSFPAMEEPRDYSFLDEEEQEYYEEEIEEEFEEEFAEEMQEYDEITEEETVYTQGRSKIAALLMAIFLGHMGIDRFYLGYIGMGILKLLTGGGFGILWLADIIRIAIGNLRDANGNELI